MRPILALLAAITLSACSTPSTETSLQLTPAAYAEAFDAAREALLDCNFTLERIDAQAGVITTQPKPTAGLLSPWDPEQSSLRAELEDAANDQRRIVRIEFRPAGDPPQPPAATPGESVELPPSPAEADRIIADVRVVVERRHIPNRTIEPESIRRSGGSLDIDLIVRGMQPVYYVPVHDDPELAARIVQLIKKRLEG